MHLLLTLRANRQSLRFPLSPGEYILGSAPSCPVHVPHPSVSSRHARIRVGANLATVEDLGSRNGSLVNLRRASGPTPVGHGAELSFGAISGVAEIVEDGNLESEASPPQKASKPTGMADGNQEVVAGPFGSLEQFSLEHIPALLDLLLQKAAALTLAQQVGERLFETFSLARLEILRISDGPETVWFSASSATEPPQGTCRFHFEQHGIRISGELQGPSRLASFGAVVQACARMIALAQPPRRKSPALPSNQGDDPPPAPGPATVDPYLQEVYRQAARIARGEISVVIQGESGTGKEILAHHMHACSGRPKEKFFALNCAALPRDLLEAELFGIERAVATGVDARAGKFELADGGTLFLDEIGDMGPETQAKILRVIQEQEVFRLGGNHPRPARVRVLSATNRDLEAMVSSGTFRQDLYHRIAAWVVELPPLRRRLGDIPNLAAYFLEKEAHRRGLRIAGITRAAMEELLAHSWPGNVRELQSAIARASLFLDDGDTVDSRHLWRTLRRNMEGPPRSLKERMLRFERQQVRGALQACDGDPDDAAIRLGVSRATIYRRIKSLGLQDSAKS